jgi:hypothetical protein
VFRQRRALALRALLLFGGAQERSMTKLEKMQRAFELLSEAAKLLDQVGEPEAELLSEQVSECANGVGLLITVDR